MFTLQTVPRSVPWMVIACLGALSSTAWAAPQYDLLLKGGHVLDVRNNVDAVLDVAIAAGKISRIARNIPTSEARRSVNVSGLYVIPGLVDLHTHVYVGTNTGGAHADDHAVYADAHAPRSGVTTVVDAGSSGWRTFPDFKHRIIDRTRTRVLVLLNIVGSGMVGEGEQDTNDMDATATARRAREFPDIIVGIKTAHFRGPEWAALDRAVEAGKIANVPVMVDYGGGHANRPFPEALRRMRPGDMYTHIYGRPRPVLDEKGEIQAHFAEARKRGVLFDVGHGGRGFIFRQVIPPFQTGWMPDSISTDLRYRSMNAPMKDMLNIMSRFLNIGMTLKDVIQRATNNPALQIKRPDLGHLGVGAVADVAVVRLRKGEFGFVDVNGALLKGSQKLEAELTLREGKVVWDLNGLTRDDWRKLTKDYGLQGDESWDATLEHPKTPVRQVVR